jgi:hypothetical protein
MIMTEEPSGHIGKTEGEFSVCQFFVDGSYEYVRRRVSVEEAIHAVKHYTQSKAVQLGIVQRVIITDGYDCINFEWRADLGIIFPPPPKGHKEAN